MIASLVLYACKGHIFSAACFWVNYTMVCAGEVRDGSSYSTETRRIILSLDRIRKVAPGGKEVLKNISLGMYLVSATQPGAADEAAHWGGGEGGKCAAWYSYRQQAASYS